MSPEFFICLGGKMEETAQNYVQKVWMPDESTVLLFLSLNKTL